MYSAVHVCVRVKLTQLQLLVDRTSVNTAVNVQHHAQGGYERLPTARDAQSELMLHTLLNLTARLELLQRARALALQVLQTIASQAHQR
jgi:hypothetical protein